MIIKFKKLSKDAVMPSYAHPGDAGLDLFSQEKYALKPGERHEFALGFALEILDGFVALVWDKSGLSYKHGLKTMGGVIDATYRGEYKVMLANLSNEAYTVEKGDKIAQLLIQSVSLAQVIEVEELNESKRGKNGFGSTGK